MPRRCLLVVNTIEVLLVIISLCVGVPVVVDVAGGVHLHEVEPAGPLAVLEVPRPQLHYLARGRIFARRLLLSLLLLRASVLPQVLVVLAAHPLNGAVRAVQVTGGTTLSRSSTKVSPLQVGLLIIIIAHRRRLSSRSIRVQPVIALSILIEQDSLVATLKDIFNLIFFIRPLLLVYKGAALFIHVLKELLYAVFLLSLNFFSDLLPVLLIPPYQDFISYGPSLVAVVITLALLQLVTETYFVIGVKVELPFLALSTGGHRRASLGVFEGGPCLACDADVT